VCVCVCECVRVFVCVCICANVYLCVCLVCVHACFSCARLLLTYLICIAFTNKNQLPSTSHAPCMPQISTNTHTAAISMSSNTMLQISTAHNATDQHTTQCYRSAQHTLLQISTAHNATDQHTKQCYRSAHNTMLQISTAHNRALPPFHTFCSN